MIQQNYFTNIQLANVPLDRHNMQPGGFSNPPTSFSNLPIHRELEKAQGAFMVAILNEAANKASTTPGRCYQWNAFCASNFNNQELMDTIILAANYTAMGIAKGSYQDVDRAAAASIPYIVEARGAYIAAIYPDLLRMYPTHVQNTINGMAQQYVDLCNEVTGYINSVVLRSTGFNNSGGVTGFGNNNRTSFGGTTNFGNNTTGFGNNNNNSGFNAGFGTTGRSFNTAPTGGGFGGANSNTNNRNSGNRTPFVNVRQEEANAGFAGAGVLNVGNQNNNKGSVDIAGIIKLLPAAAANKVLENHAKVMDAEIKKESRHVSPTEVFIPKTPVTGKWVATKEQMFPPACSTEKKRILESKDNVLVYKIVNKTNKELTMDRAQHSTGTTGNAINRGTQFKVDGKAINSRGDYLKASLDAIAATHDTAFNVNEKEFAESVQEYYIGGYSLLEGSETSLAAAINTARQMKLLTTDLNQLGAHRVDVDLDQLFVIPKDEYAAFEQILKTTSLELLAAKLKAALLDDQHSLAFNSALIQLDAYIKTNLIASVKNEYGLTDYTSLDSFVDDYGDLTTAIKEDGEHFYTALKKNERAFIARYLTLSDTYEVIGDENGSIVNAVIKVRSSITVVDFLYRELDMDLVPNVSNVVQKDQFPKIYEFLDELVSNDYIQEGEIYYGKHCLVTADNEILMIYRSNLDGRTILISKV